MNGNQNMRPEIKSPVNGNPAGNSGFVKVRRKLGLTFVLSNPFKVPVAQTPPARAASEADSNKKAKKNPFKVGTASRAV